MKFWDFTRTSDTDMLSVACKRQSILRSKLVTVADPMAVPQIPCELQFSSPYISTWNNIINRANVRPTRMELPSAVFSSVFLPESIHNVNLKSYIPLQEWNISVTPEMVFERIKHVPKNKASPDIHTLLYKVTSAHLAMPLSKLFKMSIASNTSNVEA